jgi:hypothetical protein
MDKQNREFYMEVNRIIHEQSLCGKTMKFEDVMKVVVSVVNFIRFHEINRHQFQYFCWKLMLKMSGRLVLYRSPMADSWDSVESFLAMRLEVDVFVNNRKGEDVTELRDKK